MHVPSAPIHQPNHRKCNYKELTLGSSKLPEVEERDRRTISFATKTGSAHATGLNKQHGYATTKQAMANASSKDKIDS